ncbi:MAG: Alginate O-acetyltransferase AlgI family protein [Parcubacteria group bacterium GW2011_GWC2_39_14]|nr:MAG: Alginate O-acetyltransferase AlgI family protein [Parcubacteria group bacterium GW2011_GWC2_39_14]KKR54856.1 MAG: Alginate O-acetyltransferase AlgI family protein [Parcubacteria group bacterium GW2011_GWA2_40_23]
MLFSSPIFLFLFLPVLFGIYFLADRKFKNIILLIFSLLFYAWGEPIYVLLMIASITVSYVLALLIEKQADVKKRKGLLILSVVLHIGALVFFKYSNLLVDTFSGLLHINIPFGPVGLPIGISFFTFQALSYVIDVYRKEVAASKSLFNLALYISFFPQLIAGPIVRYKDIDDQLLSRKETVGKFSSGVQRFIIGLTHKVILANFAGKIADSIFALPEGDLKWTTAWIGIFAYSLQIYFDFAGYSSMAIGLGRMFGFEFLENFNYPYISHTITEFWRRWHISLSTWFRDYVYIPLGGNRSGATRTTINQFIVFGLCGLWHGALWSFLIWGLYHGALLTIEKISFVAKARKHIPRFLNTIITFILVMIGWIIFKADSVSSTDYFKSFLGFGTGAEKYILTSLDITILLAGALFALPVIPYLSRFNWFMVIKKYSSVFAFILLAIDLMVLISSSYNPFIYFRF